MTEVQFRNFLEGLKKAWETRNPRKAASLCAEKILWYENPFDKPLKIPSAVLKEWQTVLDQKDIKVSYEIEIVNDKFGIAHWNAKFTRILSEEKVELDGIWQASFDQEGKCIEFKQWYSVKPD